MPTPTLLRPLCLIALCLISITAMAQERYRTRVRTSIPTDAAIRTIPAATLYYQQPIEEGVYSINIAAATRSAVAGGINMRALEQAPNTTQVKLSASFATNSYQHWIFAKNGNGTYTLSNFESGRCLSYDADNSLLIADSCDGGAAQQWYVWGSNGNFTLQNAGSQTVLSLYNTEIAKSIESGLRVSRQINRVAARRELLVMMQQADGNIGKRGFSIEPQKCDIRLVRKVLNADGDIAVLRPNLKAFMLENNQLLQQQKDLIRVWETKAKTEEEPIYTSPNSLANSASNEELETLLGEITILKTRLDASTSDIHYFLGAELLNGGGVIHEITRPALAELNTQLALVASLVDVPKLDKSQREQVIKAATKIREITNDSTKVVFLVFKYASFGQRKLRVAAIDDNGNTLNNVRFYVMGVAQLNENAQFFCPYYICETTTLRDNADLNTSDAIFSMYGYYHVFAVQSRNGIDTIIGCELLPPATELLTVRADL